MPAADSVTEGRCSITRTVTMGSPSCVQENWFE